jgi:catechol 2,3-dioxygenase-like lactoylglutathione lyase family enzyme
MTILGLDHVQITVPRDCERAARDFYCGLLGLSELTKPLPLQPRGGFWLAVGDRQVHIGIEDGVDRRATKAHVAYAVNDLDRWRERLAIAGIRVEDSIAIDGVRRFEFRDPFGNRVEMAERTVPAKFGRRLASRAPWPAQAAGAARRRLPSDLDTGRGTMGVIGRVVRREQRRRRAHQVVTANL